MPDCSSLAKAFPSDNPEHAALLEEAKANRNRLFPGGDAAEPNENEVRTFTQTAEMLPQPLHTRRV